MLFSQLLVSLILIVCVFLVKRFPNLIAGYNTLSNAEKEKIDINRLSAFLKTILIGLGMLTLFLYFILKFANVKNETILMTNTSIIVLIIIIASIVANTKYRN